MKVVVCIKQVPDTKGGVKFKPDGTLDRGARRWRIVIGNDA